MMLIGKDGARWVHAMCVVLRLSLQSPGGAWPAALENKKHALSQPLVNEAASQVVSISAGLGLPNL
jgi:hypothetical protein